MAILTGISSMNIFENKKTYVRQTLILLNGNVEQYVALDHLSPGQSLRLANFNIFKNEICQII